MRQALSLRTVPPRGLEQPHALRMRLRPRCARGRWKVGRWGGTVAWEDGRQPVQMGHTEAAGQRSCETSG
jgi:hypothetical protein